MKNFIVSVLLFIIVGISFAQIPDGYYNAALNKSGYALKTSLYNIIDGHTVRSYDNVWIDLATTDVRADGKIWDMYSNCNFTVGETSAGGNQCGNVSANECFCYNREHSMPQSWFGGKVSPMHTDLFHIYPTDGQVNGMRSNFPFGEVGTATKTSDNGSKLGPSSIPIPSYSDDVFEPIDEYKGDFARTYFYMATRYENVIDGWQTANGMLAGTSNQVYTDWAKEMLVRWHTDDPVSQKELDRNNAVHGIQRNRNPFIDFPNLVDKIWGDDGTAFDGTNDPGTPPIGNPTHIRYELRDSEGNIIKNKMIELKK